MTTLKEIINEALAGVKNTKALKAKSCIVEPIKGDIHSENIYHFSLKLCVGGQLLFEYSGALERIMICAITDNTKFEETISCEGLNLLLEKQKEYIRFSVENALKHLYFVSEREVEKRYKSIIEIVKIREKLIIK
jgi:hypothetical protein